LGKRDERSLGFSKIKIEPHLGTTTKVGGEMPHSNGKISVNYELKKKKWIIHVHLPQNTPGKLIWKGKNYELNPGDNSLVI